MSDSIFSRVKASVSAKDAAAFYGIEVNKHGMSICPFHPDRNPSLKLDRRFHCFGCGADGDVIDFTGRLFGLTPLEAARKLASDFGADVSAEARPNDKIARPIVSPERQKKLDERDCINDLVAYHDKLASWKNTLCPKTPDEEWDERFEEALAQLDYINHLMDVFWNGEEYERNEIVEKWKGGGLYGGSGSKTTA